ncbi:hypothetical protein V1503_21330 [Bacillus sp. SCS-151]|uniref:hypothetical protein n=1 Tax=Nanhaiella sioensis TaxID=3115293 RepID=UPI00397E6740
MKIHKMTFFIISLFILVSCSSKTIGEPDISEQVYDELGEGVVIPEFENYPMVFAIIQMPPIGNSKKLTIVYAEERGEIIEDFSDPAVIQAYEKETNSKFLYGVYEGKTVLEYTYIEDGGISFSNGKTMVLNGKTIEYVEKKNDKNEFLFVALNYEGAAYSFTFNLSEEFVQEAAFKIVESVINEVDNELDS